MEMSALLSLAAFASARGGLPLSSPRASVRAAPLLPSARSALTLRGGWGWAQRDDEGWEAPWWHSHNKEASDLFNNLRTPATLIAAAVFGSAFALQPSTNDSFLVARVKRWYTLLAVASLCSELLTIVASTSAMQKLTQAPQKSASVNSLLHDSDYEFFWVVSSVNFLLGLLGLTLMVGLQTWVKFGNQEMISKRVGLVITGTILLVLSLLCDEAGGFALDTWRLFGGKTDKSPEYTELIVSTSFKRYLVLLVERAASGSALTLLAIFCIIYTTVNFYS